MTRAKESYRGLLEKTQMRSCGSEVIVHVLLEGAGGGAALLQVALGVAGRWVELGWVGGL